MATSPNYQTDIFSGPITAGAVEKNNLKKIIGGGVRLASLDFYRGLVMVLLMLEASGLYEYGRTLSKPGSFIHSLAIQFDHAQWHGLHFWDLIQPAFMFIAGTAMAFSLTKQTAKGSTWKQQAEHALRRSWWLFFWGVLDYAVRGNHLSFELWDVLTQLSFYHAGCISHLSLEAGLSNSFQHLFTNPE